MTTKTDYQLASRSVGWVGIGSILAALIGCSSSGGSNGTGGTTGMGTGGGASPPGGGGPSTSGGMTGSSGAAGSPTGGGAPGVGGAPSVGGVPATSGGVPGTSGAPSTAGSAGGPSMVTCSSTNKATTTLDKTGWVPRECNNFGIQGAWYCYDDGMSPSGCTASMTPFVEGKGMCLKGSTLGMPMTWGAGIGLSLNDSGTANMMTAVKSAYDAKSNGVIGFKIGLSGTTGGLPLRINFPKFAKPDGVSPFKEVPGAPTTEPYTVLLSDALVPEAWDVPNAGETADPTSIFDVQVQIPGDAVAASYDFCITELTPITDGSMMPMGGVLMPYGSAVCGNLNAIDVPNYWVQNNAYGGNSHCIQARTDNASKAGFLISNLQANKAPGGAPGSYPSVVYGWHVDGAFHGGYKSAKQLSAITSIPTSMSVTVPSSGRYNTSYDNWINASPTAGSSAGTLEQMIWLNYRDTTPIGTKVATASLAGTTWDVWYGTHEGFATVSYIRVNANTMTFDLKEFMNDTVQRGYAQAGAYLLGIQAGFEIWEGTGSGFSVDSFNVSVQ